jgi:hypothetical protein
MFAFGKSMDNDMRQTARRMNKIYKSFIAPTEKLDCFRPLASTF